MLAGDLSPAEAAQMLNGKDPLTAQGKIRAWPTPVKGDGRSSGSRNTPHSKAHAGISLTDAVRGDGGTGRIYPTPTVQDSANNGGPSQYERNSLPLNAAIKARSDRGALSPDWVAWIMGWPIGWTDLAPLDALDWRTWDADPADTGEIPRITTHRTHRRQRLACLGNGQVPQCAAWAWAQLIARVEGVDP